MFLFRYHLCKLFHMPCKLHHFNSTLLNLKTFAKTVVNNATCLEFTQLPDFLNNSFLKYSKTLNVRTKILYQSVFGSRWDRNCQYSRRNVQSFNFCTHGIQYCFSEQLLQQKNNKKNHFTKILIFQISSDSLYKLVKIR